MSLRTLNLDDTLYNYLLAHSVREHPAQTALRHATSTHPNAGMQISPDQAQLMGLLVRLMGARRAIEIGVFTGYSALSVALALPEDGMLLACDVSDEYTRVGRPYWRQAGVEHKIVLELGPATDTLDAQLAAGRAGTFDFAFIDADKQSYDDYYELCLRLLRPGGLMVIDNVLRNGSVVHPARNAETAAIQALNDKLRDDPRVDIAMLPVADGITLARKRQAG
jgi:caffeoyl-CoA O-methyltransferase